MNILYDEGTPEEKWWTGIAVEKLSEESHCIYFHEDQEVATVSNTECGMFDEEAGGIIGKKVQLPFPDEAVGSLKDNSYPVLFVADHEISYIKHQFIQFC